VRGAPVRSVWRALTRMPVAWCAHAGVLWLDSTEEGQNPPWQKPDVNCGLPMRDLNRFQRVAAIAADPTGRLFMAAGTDGIFRGSDPAGRHEGCSTREFSEQVTLPDTWLFCSGEHEIIVVSEDEAHRD